jgi:ATPase subunit of ABC transporter with duplicated ATPase domains
MLQMHQISYDVRPGLPLFAGASLQLNPRDRVALVGPNGAGKTTLLRILAGELEPDTGRVIRRSGLRLTYLPQEPPRLAGLSAGQRMRAELARCLLSDADVVLLDEPTNHLDSAAREWLERLILRSEAAMVVVSHDRGFINRIATRTAELRRGSLRLFEGNYDRYLSQRELVERQQWQRYETSQRRAAAEAEAAERRLRLSLKVARAPEGAKQSHDFYRAKAARVARTSRILKERSSRVKQAEKPWEEQAIPALDFSHVPRSEEIVARASLLTKGYDGRTVIDGLDWEVARGDRWVLSGPNGSGKSTLLRLLLGEERADSGQLRVGAKARIGYLAQEGENLRPDRTALELCLDAIPDETRARTMLACLKMPADQVLRPLRTLSAGERTKAGLAYLLLSGANLLLLDEPTNHLEIEAREALEQALAGYPGTLILVTHDEWLAAAVATHRLELKPLVVSG